MKYNPKIHHRQSIRLCGHDYSQAGLYFQNQKCLFDKIVNGKIISNGAGVGANGRSPLFYPPIHLSIYH